MLFRDVHHVLRVFPSAAPAQQVFRLMIRFPRRCMTSHAEAVSELVPLWWQVGGRGVQMVKNLIPLLVCNPSMIRRRVHDHHHQQ